MLFGNESDPGRQASPGRELFPITHFSDQGGGDHRTNARDLLEPPAFFTRATPGMDVLLEHSDLCRDYGVLAGKNIETNLAAAGIRPSFWSVMTLNSSAVPLRPFAEIMPNSAICPRIAFDSIVR